MARGHINSITPDPDGTLMPAATAGDAANDHTFTNTGRTMVLVTNSGAVSRVAEVVITRTVQGQTPPVLTRTLAAGERWLFGRFPVEDFGKLLQFNVNHAELTMNVVEP